MKFKYLFLGLFAAANLSAADFYVNPVVNYSLPDPTVIKGDDGYFYLFSDVFCHCITNSSELLFLLSGICQGLLK